MKNLLEIDFDESAFLEIMPEWEGCEINITIISGGITNKLYRVRSEKGDLVVRIYGNKTEMFINRDYEARALEEMARIGVSPELVKYLPKWNVTIVEFITYGYTMQNKDFSNENLLEIAADTIRRIHNSEILLPNIFNPLTEVKRMAGILNNLNVEYPEFDIAGTIRHLEKLFEVINIPQREYTVSHNDLLADNFILIQDEHRNKYNEPMYIIDWEYAGMAPRYYDIADMFQEILVSRDIEKKIIRNYCENKEFDKNLYLIDLFKPYPDIFWFLWSLIQQNISSIEFDFYNYGKVKYENALKNLEFIIKKYGIKI